MHIITWKPLKRFGESHPDAKSWLAMWRRESRKARWRNFAELRATFPAADSVDRYIVFNVAGNKYRLITSIHFNRGRVYIRRILTHKEYDRGDWKNA